jgi:hypothetical protein
MMTGFSNMAIVVTSPATVIKQWWAEGHLEKDQEKMGARVQMRIKYLVYAKDLKQKEQCWRYHSLDLKLYCRAMVTKTVRCWHKNRHVDQWNRTEDPEIRPHRYSHLTVDKGAKNIHWKKDSFFSKWYWENWIFTCRRLKLGPHFSPYIKIN